MRIKPSELFNWLFIKPYTFYWIGTAIAVGGSIAGGIKGRRDARDAADDVGAITAQNIKMLDEEEVETLRQMDYTYDQVVGESQAKIAASGVAMEGSPADYMAAMEDNYGQERAWTKKQYESQREATRLSGSAQQSALKNQGDSALLSGVSSAAGWWSGGFGSNSVPSGSAPATPAFDPLKKVKPSNINLTLAG